MAGRWASSRRATRSTLKWKSSKSKRKGASTSAGAPEIRAGSGARRSRRPASCGRRESGAVVSPLSDPRKLRDWMKWHIHWPAGILALVGVVFFAADRLTRQPTVVHSVSEGRQEISIPVSRDGHYYLGGTVN